MKCKFCEQVEYAVEYDTLYPSENRLRNYKVRLYQETVHKEHKNDVCGVLQYKPLKLNYCPVCGRNLRKEVLNGEKKSESFKLSSEK